MFVRQWVYHLILPLYCFLFTEIAIAQSTQNQQLTFEGSLTDSDGNPLNLSGQNLFFYVVAFDGSNNKCILFAESSTNSGNEKGEILHRYGSGLGLTSPVSYNHSLDSQVFSGSITGKQSGPGNTSCSVLASADRFLEIYSSVLDISAILQISSVPYAKASQNSQKLNGKLDTDFVLASSFVGGTAGQVLSRNNDNGFSWISLPVQQAITSSTVISALGYTPANSSGTISLSSNQVTGILPAEKLPAFSGDVISVSGTLLEVARIKGTEISNILPADQQILTFSSASNQWKPITPTFVKSGGDTLSGTYTFNQNVRLPSAQFAVVSSPVATNHFCSPTEEGMQRYNSNFKVMEFCNGSSWQGLSGITYCDSGYKLIGTPGNPQAFCVQESLNPSPINYISAATNCEGFTNSRKTKPQVCSIEQLDKTCEANVIPGFSHPDQNINKQWTSSAAGIGRNHVISYESISSSNCHLASFSETEEGRIIFFDSTVTNLNISNKYRCCYQ